MNPWFAFAGGVYLTGLGFSFFIIREAVSFGPEPAWVKRLVAFGGGLAWPITTAVTVGMKVRDIFR